MDGYSSGLVGGEYLEKSGWFVELESDIIEYGELAIAKRQHCVEETRKPGVECVVKNWKIVLLALDPLEIVHVSSPYVHLWKQHHPFGRTGFQHPTEDRVAQQSFQLPILVASCHVHKCFHRGSTPERKPGEVIDLRKDGFMRAIPGQILYYDVISK